MSGGALDGIAIQAYPWGLRFPLPRMSGEASLMSSAGWATAGVLLPWSERWVGWIMAI